MTSRTGGSPDDTCLLKDVGVAEFNKQHLRLASYVVEYAQVVEKLDGGAPEVADWRHLQALVGRMKRFVVEHFDHEEKMLTEHGYPGLEGQKKEHGKFKKQLASFAADIDDRNHKSLVKYSKVMWTWLFDHINRHDFQYRDFFIEKGVR
ncbi:MAG: hemerythrin family protein [Magnetococcales bacterium]|nr:hemerythrin family protein [Magnetococcales bacterium]